MQAEWAACCSAVTSSRPGKFRYLVHAIDTELTTPDLAATKITNPSRQLSSLSYITESQPYTFLDLRVGLIYHVPAKHFIASSAADFASNHREDLAPLYSRSIGLQTPSEILAEPGPPIWNEVLVFRVLEADGATSQIVPQGIFIKSTATDDEVNFASRLSEITTLPIVWIN